MEMPRVRNVPPLASSGIRTRKRCDDDSASTENDSMRPLAPEPRRSKRRRTLLVDAFSSISLKREGDEMPESHGHKRNSRPNQTKRKDESLDNEDADSSQAVAEDDGGYTTNSSLEVEDGDTEDYGEDEPMLSDKEATKKDVERKV
jgi:hypothetical protein